jgi:hypothetical protein
VILLLIHRGGEDDANKVLQLTEKAKDVMESSKEVRKRAAPPSARVTVAHCLRSLQYPQEEIEWLLKALWNHGLYVIGWVSLSDAVSAMVSPRTTLTTGCGFSIGDKATAQKYFEASLATCKYHGQSRQLKEQVRSW